MAEPADRTFAVPPEHPVFRGHFPGFPVVPGSMLLEWVMDEAARELGLAAPRLRVREAKFYVPLGPAQRAELALASSARRCQFVIRHADATIASGVLEWDGDA